MKNSSVDRWNKWWIVCLLAALLPACYEPIQGCLDAQATNFQVDADEPCPDDCCTYPSIVLNFQHCYEIAQDSFVALNYGDSVYIDAAGNPFRFSSLQYYLSEFKLVRSDGALIGVTDTLQVDQIDPVSGDTSKLTLEDNFLLINPVQKSINVTLGNFTEVANFTGIQFKLGLDTPANQVDPASVQEVHPLSFQDDNMYVDPEEGYIFYKLGLFTDTVATDTIPVITSISGLENLKTIDLAFPFSTTNGFNINVSLRVDYQDWLEGIDIQQSLSDGSFEQKLLENVGTSITVQEIR